MRVYGDISGNYGNLIARDCDVVVQVLVAGPDEHTCGSCAKRVVRQLGNQKEAKWNELPSVEKRRVADCFQEASNDIQFRYAKVTRSKIFDLYAHHLLFDGDGPNADLIPKVIGIIYAHLFIEHVQSSEDEGNITSLIFDNIYSRSQSEIAIETISSLLPDTIGFHNIRAGNSSRELGIQTADCFAGMVAEHELDRGDWTAALNNIEYTNDSAPALAGVENFLHRQVNRH